MAIKRLPGRPTKKEADKVKVVSAYLTTKEKNKIEKVYENITAAIRQEVLPKCG